MEHDREHGRRPVDRSVGRAGSRQARTVARAAASGRHGRWCGLRAADALARRCWPAGSPSPTARSERGFGIQWRAIYRERPGLFVDLDAGLWSKGIAGRSGQRLIVSSIGGWPAAADRRGAGFGDLKSWGGEAPRGAAAGSSAHARLAAAGNSPRGTSGAELSKAGARSRRRYSGRSGSNGSSGSASAARRGCRVVPAVPARGAGTANRRGLDDRLDGRSRRLGRARRFDGRTDLLFEAGARNLQRLPAASRNSGSTNG